MLCDTTPHRALVMTNGLWSVAACTWHEPPTDTCSVVSASPSHSISIKIIIPDFPLYFMRFPVGHSNPTTVGTNGNVGRIIELILMEPMDWSVHITVTQKVIVVKYKKTPTI